MLDGTALTLLGSVSVSGVALLGAASLASIFWSGGRRPAAPPAGRAGPRGRRYSRPTRRR